MGCAQEAVGAEGKEEIIKYHSKWEGLVMPTNIMQLLWCDGMVHKYNADQFEYLEKVNNESSKLDSLFKIFKL